MTAAVDGGCRASAREASLVAQVTEVRQRARNEHRHAMNLINESKAKLLAYRQRTAKAENKLMLVKVNLPFNFIFRIYAGAAAVALAAAAAAERY